MIDSTVLKTTASIALAGLLLAGCGGGAKDDDYPGTADVYGADDAGEQFINDFVAAWGKVMDLDRFDLT